MTITLIANILGLSQCDYCGFTTCLHLKCLCCNTKFGVAFMAHKLYLLTRLILWY